MKIAFVNHPWSMALPPVGSDSAGSLSIWTWEVARRLARQHEVWVYEGHRRFSRPRLEPCEGVHYKILWTGLDELLLRVWRRVRRNEPIARQVAARSFYYWGYALQVALEVRRRRFDVVHIHQCSQFAPLIRALNPDTSIVLHMNCEWLTAFAAELIAPRLETVTRVFGCSDYITNLIRERFPFLGDRCQTVPNGVDEERFTTEGEGIRSSSSDDGVKHLAFVGRVSPEKGVHDLVEAFSLVARQRTDVALDLLGPEGSLPVEWIVGVSSNPVVSSLRTFYEGSYRSHLEKRIDAAAAERVTFVGRVPYTELNQRYQEMAILINPSLSESFGMTVVEAMASGKPVIVTQTGGMTETVLHGETGLIVPPANPKALAEAILFLLENKALCESMGAAGRSRVTALYSWDRVVERWLDRSQQADERLQPAAVN